MNDNDLPRARHGPRPDHITPPPPDPIQAHSITATRLSAPRRATLAESFAFAIVGQAPHQPLLRGEADAERPVLPGEVLAPHRERRALRLHDHLHHTTTTTNTQAVSTTQPSLVPLLLLMVMMNTMTTTQSQR
jgi:hypothetical protein